MRGGNFEQVSKLDKSLRTTSSMSTAPIERSHYWVFDEEQLKAAADDYCGDRGGPAFRTGAELASELHRFLNSPHVVERGMRRGGND